MALVGRDQEIETLSPNGPDQPFTECIRLRRSDRRFQCSYTESLQLGIQGRRKNRVPIVNDEAVRMIEWQELAELLDGPLGGGMLSHVAVENPPRADFHRDKDVQNPERGRHRNEEVTSYHRPGMAPNKSRPALAARTAA